MSEEHRSETILAADFGTANTRVTLFDVVEGVYRFVAAAEAPTTAAPPYSDASEGLRHALDELHAITGRTMLDEAARLIVPSTSDGTGADAFVATASAGPVLRAVLVGLLPEISLQSARRVAESHYISVVDSLSLVDRRREGQQIDAIRSAQPDVIVIAGGTDGGARDALLRLVDVVGLGCFVLPPDLRTSVLYLGNADLRTKIGETLGSIATMHTAHNPIAAPGAEALEPARAELGRIVEELRLYQIGGFRDLATYAGGRIVPSAQAEGQAVRFISQTLHSPRGVLSVNVGSAATVVAAAFGGALSLSVSPELGVGVHAANLLNDSRIDQFTRWLPVDAADDAVLDFLHNKSAHPHTVPDEADDAYFEHALARQVMQVALRRARTLWPRKVPGSRADLLPWCDLIIGGGAVLARAPSYGAAALMLLDALQPTGATTLAVDQHHMLAALGALAHVNPIAAVQVIESSPFLELGSVFSTVGAARPGDVVCRVKLTTADGQEAGLELKAGEIEVLSLPMGQTAKINLKPRAGIDVGFGAGRGRTLEISGGVVGVILDARGRPLPLAGAAEARREKLQRWLWKLSPG